MKKSESIVRTPLPTRAGPGWIHALRGALVLMLLCGGLYPLIAVSIGAALFPYQSNGSLIEQDGKVIGSALVGQLFNAPSYFHGRPSAAGYDPFAVSGSNLAPSNPDLRVRADAAAMAISDANDLAPAAIPVDLIAASASGIDPHISPEAAAIQIDRVAAARGLTHGAVKTLVAAQEQQPVLGILGQPRVNVLQLNLALDNLGPQSIPAQ